MDGLPRLKIFVRHFIGVFSIGNYKFRNAPRIEDLIRTDVQNFADIVCHGSVHIEFSEKFVSGIADGFALFFRLANDYTKKVSASFTISGYANRILTVASRTDFGVI